jgi:hypothetical protein
MKVLLLLLSLLAAGCGHLPLLAETTTPVRPEWTDLAPAPGCARVRVPFRGLSGICRSTAIARAKAALTANGGTRMFHQPTQRLRRWPNGDWTAEVCVPE